MKRYLMKCGHVNNAYEIQKDGTKVPACAICDCTEIVRTVRGTDGLEDRQMRCSYCGSIAPSNWDAAFFEYKPSKSYDKFYDGCQGWD